jgi:hypothetical protein
MGMSARKIDSPFVGLVPYTEDDAEFFFGRERDQQRILANLFASRLTILYGASGVGKSSVLRAGIIREVRERIHAAVEAGEDPEVAVVYCKDWKDDVLARLRGAIGSALHDLLGRDFVAELDSSLSLKQLLLEIGNRFNGDLLLIFDQFEEYFLYHPGAQPDAFAAEFAEAANHAGLTAHFLLALRDDAVSRLDRFKPLIPGLFSNYLRLHHLSADDAQAAILQPVARYNELPDERKGTRGQFSVAADLPAVVIDEVYAGRVLVGQVGQGTVGPSRAAAVETPYLQMVMTRLWQAEVAQGSHELRTETLRQLGGAEAIVKGHLEAALAGFSEREKQFCAAMFPHLVTPSGTKIAHTLSNLAKFAKVAPEELTPLLDTLAGSEKRILAPVAPPDSEPGQLQYEIYHDSLAQAVLSWQARYEAERERATRDKEKHRLLVYAVAFAIAFLIAAGGAAIAIWQWRAASAERANAKRAEDKALALQSEANANRYQLELAIAEKQQDASRVAELKQLLAGAQSDTQKFTERANSQGAAASGPALADLVRERDQLREKLAQTTAEKTVHTDTASMAPAANIPPVRPQTPQKQVPVSETAPPPEVKASPPEESKQKERAPEGAPKTLPEIAGAAVLLAQSMDTQALGVELARYVVEKARAAGSDPSSAIEAILRRGAGMTSSMNHPLANPRMLRLAVRNGSTVAAVHDGKTCCIVDLTKRTQTCFASRATVMEWSPNASEMVLGGHELVVFDLAGNARVTGPTSVSQLAALAVSGDGLVAYSRDAYDGIRFFSDGKPDKTLFPTHKRIVGLAFLPQHNNTPGHTALISVDSDCAVSWWDYPSGQKVDLGGGTSQRPTSIASVGDGNPLLAIAYAKGIELYHLTGGGHEGFQWKVESFAFSPDGSRLAVSDGSNVDLLKVSNHQPIVNYGGGRLVAISRDGHTFAIAKGNTIAVYPGDLGAVMAQARERTPRLTASQCKEYLGLNSCPSF